MTTGKFTLVIRWPSGQSTICGEMTDHQHGEICRILSPDYRAQLPSQGGEAVAWAICKEPGRVDWLSATYANKRAAQEHVASYKDGPTLYITPLYTHPADQVADDLTMVKVSRELLQDLRDLAFDQVEHHRAAMGAYKQTRQSAMDSVLAQADALLEVKP